MVADADSIATVDTTGLKVVPVEEANLSAARNAGIAVAGGDVCVFIDDDAAAEPLWLTHHAAALQETGAAASVGFVRGRNGISYQSRVASIDREAETHVEKCDTEAAYIPPLDEGRALKLIGTNAAIGRHVLCTLGGFDTAFAYFLDDADVSLRLAGAGYTAVVAPLAEVHHAFAPSPRRTAMRAPSDLFDIGRSSAIYFRRHPGAELDELFQRIRVRERARVVRHLVAGTCEPRDLPRLMASLEDGWSAGLSAALPTLSALSMAQNDFRPLTPRAGSHVVISSRFFRRRRTLAKAGDLAESGRRVSFFSFSLTPVRHHVSYTESGVWSQTGGQFGRSVRSDFYFKWCRFAQRQKEEIRRVAKVRGI